jgi:hypothetical protein
MSICCRALVLLFAFSAVSVANFEAGAPKDPVEEESERVGSIVKDKGALLYGVFNGGKGAAGGEKASQDKAPENEVNERAQDSDRLRVTKPEGVKAASRTDKLFDAALKVLGDFPLDIVDRSQGKIETVFMKVNDFDNTNTCTYKISIIIRNSKDLSVSVSSKEDSQARVRKHEEALKKRILDSAS